MLHWGRVLLKQLYKLNLKFFQVQKSDSKKS